MPRSFALGEQFETFIDEEVRSGRFHDASEVVREALRRLQEAAPGELKGAQKLRTLVEEARRDGVLVDAAPAFDRLSERYAQRR